MPLDIAPARNADALDAVRLLFREYAASLDIDLAYQDFASELANLPGQYAPPHGELLLAVTPEGCPAACAALRAMRRSGCCEMKRLYVRPEARGTGAARALIDQLVEAARSRGYREMWLDTLPTMQAAQRLYLGYGFEVAEAYYRSPVAGTVFMRLAL
jgi:GNAT superfamily N-acetyltransferase